MFVHQPDPPHNLAPVLESSTVSRAEKLPFRGQNPRDWLLATVKDP
jgi:hypothetical protein